MVSKSGIELVISSHFQSFNREEILGVIGYIPPWLRRKSSNSSRVDRATCSLIADAVNRRVSDCSLDLKGFDSKLLPPPKKNSPFSFLGLKNSADCSY